jgi:hypothetical protein
MSAPPSSGDEIELTPAMIEAGVARLEFLMNANSAQLVEEVYRAMARARTRRARIHLSPESVSALLSLEKLGVTREMMEAAEEIYDASDVPGLERYRLEVLVKFLLTCFRRTVVEISDK